MHERERDYTLVGSRVNWVKRKMEEKLWGDLTSRLDLIERERLTGSRNCFQGCDSTV